MTNWRTTMNDMNGRIFETTSAIAAFFELTALPDAPEVSLKAFAQAGNAKEVVEAIVQSLRQQWQTALDAQYYLFYACVRKARSATMLWLGDMLRLNLPRNRLQIDRTRVSSDAFMINIGAILLVMLVVLFWVGGFNLYM